MSSENGKLEMILESLLFLKGEPVPVAELLKLLEVKPDELNDAITKLEKNLEGRGIRLIRGKDELMLGTAPESSSFCQKMIKEELATTIGRAGLETLAIVIYKGAFGETGVSRAEIDYVRGINSAFTLRNLSIRGLVSRKINPKDKRSFLYSPTTELLQYLGVTKKEELPQYEEFLKQMNDAISNPNTD